MPGERPGPGPEAYGISEKEWTREASPESYKELDNLLLADKDIFDQLVGDKDIRAAERKKFENEEVRNPTFDYPNIDLEKLAEREARFLEIKEDFKGADPRIAKVMNEAWKKDEAIPEDLVNRISIVWKINEQIAQIRMLRAVKQSEMATAAGNTKERAIAMNKFKRYSEYLFNKPDEQINALVINRMHDEVENWMKSDNHDLADEAGQLVARLPERMPEPEKYHWPDEKNLEAWKQLTEERVGDYVKELKSRLPHIFELPEDTILTARQVNEAVKTSLDILKAKGWEGIIDPAAGGLSVSAVKEKVKSPEAEVIKAYRMLPLSVHEVFWHVARAMHGKEVSLVHSKTGPLPRIGYDRYIEGEEGLAYASEEFFDTSMRYDTRLYVASGLALGQYGKPRDFREVYDLTHRYAMCVNLSRGDDREKAESLAKTSAWLTAARVFRGTPGDQAYGADAPPEKKAAEGVASLQGLYYEAGYIKSYNFIGRMREHPDGNRLIKVITMWGKTDPANARHLWIMKRGGTTEKALDNLEIGA
jgi:hypothetical protein